MKNLLFALAGLAIAGSAQAADFKHSAEFYSKYVGLQNRSQTSGTNTRSDDSSYWTQRLMLGLDTNSGEDFSFHAGFLSHGEWGKETSNSFGTSGEADTTSLGRTEPDNSVILHEAYGYWKASDMLGVRAGRGVFRMADGLVVGSDHWDSVPEVYEGILAMFDFGFANAAFFGVKSHEFGLATSNSVYDPEQNIYGASFDFKNLPDFLKMANLHYIKQNMSPLAASNGRDFTRYGLTLSGDMSGFDYKLTYAMLSGKQRDSAGVDANDITVSANMMHVTAGYSFADMMNARLGVVYHKDSGDDDADAKTANTYEDLSSEQYYTNGFMNMVTFGNLTYTAVNFMFEPMDKTTLEFRYYMFDRTSDKANLTVAGAGTAHQNANNTKKPVGTEWGIKAGHKYSDSFQIGARYGSFTAGDYLKTDGTNNIERAAHTQASVWGIWKF